MNFDLLKQTFPSIIIHSEKIEISDSLVEILTFLKKCPEYSFDSLITIIAVDYSNYIELIYHLSSIIFNDKISVSIKVEEEINSVTSIFHSAYFDECEIYDLFGIKFIGNSKLKRLLLPESWHGFPLRKNYHMNDTRLTWNG